jgi:hypothetical protein
MRQAGHENFDELYQIQPTVYYAKFTALQQEAMNEEVLQ